VIDPYHIEASSLGFPLSFEDGSRLNEKTPLSVLIFGIFDRQDCNNLAAPVVKVSA
jgi:hypothetical protein